MKINAKCLFVDKILKVVVKDTFLLVHSTNWHSSSTQFFSYAQFIYTKLFNFVEFYESVDFFNFAGYFACASLLLLPNCFYYVKIGSHITSVKKYN